MSDFEDDSARASQERRAEVSSEHGAEQLNTEDQPDQTAADQPRSPRRPSPGAQAASRARRIGGRPLPGPRPAVGADVVDADELPSLLEEPVAPAEPETKVRARDEAADLRQRLDRLRWIPAGVAAAVVVALVVACLIASHGVWWAKHSMRPVRDQVLAAAKICLADTNSYDYRTLAENEAKGLRCGTGKFRDTYQQSMETVIKKLAPQRKASQVLQVTTAGVESVSKDGKQWVILVYGQTQIRNNVSAKSQPRLDIVSARVTMDKVGDKWLISALAAA